MNKKIKWAIPFAVLALTCGITAAGCNGCNKHEHSYTEWGYNETQHWKQCPEDDEIDQSTKEDHEFVDGSCECGATQQTPPVTDVTITNETTDTNGTVTLSKTTVKAGESVTVTVAPNEGYQLKSLTVNGANVFGAMTGNTYTFTAQENTTVVAVFEKIASSSVNSVITGKKYGVTGNSLTAGTTVTLSAEGRDDIATEIKADGDNLVIKVDEIAGDNWAVKVEGYVAATIIVPRDAAYTSAIALEYDLMENLSTSWGNYDGVDLSKQNDGKITHTGGYYQWVSSKDSYESVAITANVVKGGFRQGVFIRFKGDTYADDGFVMLAKENQQKISVCGAGDGYTGKNLWKDNWDEYLNPLAKDEYELTLVRDGANIYIFIDGEYKATKALPEGYADKECYVGLFCTDATKMENSERTFAIQDASEFLEISVTDETAAGAHGTVTIDKPTVNLNERVTVTLEPENGYKISDLKIDGVSVLSQMTGNSYTFTALKDTTVVAEFEERKPLNSLEVTVNAANGFTAEGAKISLEQLGEKQTGTVGANGKVTLGSAEKPVTTGTHNVYADFGGYQIKLGTVNVEASDSNDGTAKPVSVTLGFTGSGVEYAGSVSSANPATGELTYKLGKDDNGAYNNKYDIKTIENGGYFAQKISFASMAEAIGTGKKVSMSVILRTANGKEIKFVVQNSGQYFGINGTFCMGLDDNELGGGNGIFVGGDASKFINLGGYKDALLGDGLWIVLGYDAETGGLVTYAGTELASVRPVKTWGTLPKDLKFTGIGTGKWFDDGLNTDLVKVTLKYGATMEAIGMAIEEKVTVTASVNDEEMGTVALDATDGKYFSGTQVEVTVTANAGYVLKSIKVGDGEAVTEGWTTDGNVYTYVFTVSASNTMVVAEFEESKTVDSLEVTVNAANGFTAEGTKITLEQLGEKQTGTVGANGKVTLGSAEKPVTTGTHNVYADFGGYQIKLGTVNVEASDSNDGTAKPVSVTLGFTGSGVEYAGSVSSANPATGELTYKLGKDDNGAYNNKYDIKTIENGGYFAQKISFASMAEAIGTGKKVSMSVILRTANGKEIKFVVQNSGQYFGINGTFCMGLDDNELGGGNGIFVGGDASKFINLGGYKDALLGDGLWIVLGYDAETGGLVTYAGTELASVRPVKTWGTLPKDLKFTGIGTGKWFDDGLNTDLVKVTLKYGATMEAIGMAIEEKVTVTASVNDEEMGTVALDATDGKYFSGTQVEVTVTANAGYVLKSIKVGDGEAVTEGWTTDGNVYTYVFTVSASNTAVVATFEELQVWESATLTLNGVAENTEVKLFDGLDTITATADANGVVTFTDNNKISKKVYTVTVGDVVFNVDFTTESSIRKTIATVTVDDFKAKDNYNEGAKVIDMGGAKNSTDYVVTFNLKTNSTADGWKQRWSLLLINGDGSTTTGIGCIGKNDDQLLVWAANGASPDDKNPTKYGEAKYLKFDELVHGANGVNMKVVRHGSKATMYFELEGEWIEMLTVTLGSGETNLKFACSYGVEWQISDMAINYISEFDYLVNASFEGDAHGYKVSVAQTANAATVVIQTNDAKAAWSYFPNAITVNGTAIGFSTVTKESLGANRCKYTFTLDITENTDIVVTVDKGTLVDYNASVNDDAMGKIECDMKINYNSTDYYWNDLCTFTVTANEGYELESIVIGEGDTATTITEGWTQNGKVYTYSHLVTGDIKVVANLKHTPVVTLNNVTVSIVNGTDKVDLGESINAKLDGDTDYSVILTKGADGTYTFGGTFLCGNYKLIVLGQNVGYSPVDVVIDENTAAVSVQYLLATATKYHHGDNNGMGECDFETLIEVDADTVKINSANVNGKPVDAFWCWNSSVPEVTLNVSEEVKNVTNVTLEFNMKVANGNDSPNNAFGIAMAGYKGVAISLWNSNDDKIDLHELTGCKLGADGWGYVNTYAAFGWIETLAESANGVNIRVVREGAKITFYAQNTAIAEGEQWVKFFETTCDESAKTDIKFLGMGSDYTVADISVTVNETSNEA